MSLKEDEDAWRGWQIYIGDTFNKSPALCQRLKAVSSWYENDFIAFVDESIQESLEDKKSTEDVKLNCNLDDYYKKN